MPITYRTPPQGKNKAIQSVVIPYTYTYDYAKAWLKAHDLYTGGVDFSPNYMRFRQWDPRASDVYRYVRIDGALPGAAMILKVG